MDARFFLLDVNRQKLLTSRENLCGFRWNLCQFLVDQGLTQQVDLHYYTRFISFLMPNLVAWVEDGLKSECFIVLASACSLPSFLLDFLLSSFLQTSILNRHLQNLMDGLSAKVFRTYNASITLQEQLKALTNCELLTAFVVSPAASCGQWAQRCPSIALGSLELLAPPRQVIHHVVGWYGTYGDMHQVGNHAE